MSFFEKIFVEGIELDFLYEIAARSAIMFFFILCVLRLSGRRGIKQLTLFEVAIILGLGSAAGDPMFQPDVPIINALVVLFTVIFFYKLITWAAVRSSAINKALEGSAKVIVRDGMFDVENERKQMFSEQEFFAELRNKSVEHLGQIRIGLLEVDGTISLLYYPSDEVKFGLPLFPDDYQPIQLEHITEPVACMFCGMVVEAAPSGTVVCPRCLHQKWAPAMNTKRT